MNKTLIRSLSGAIFLIVMVGSLLIGPTLFALLTLFLIVVIEWEFFSITIEKGFFISKLLTIIASTLLYTLFYLYWSSSIDSSYFWLLTPFIIAIPSSLLYQKREERLFAMAPLMAAPLYIALPFSLTTTLLFNQQGEYQPLLLLSLFIILWSSDVGAYIFGMLFGQKKGHKLFPSISPKKTWEGFFGGLATSLIASLLLSNYTLLPLSSLESILIAITIFIFGLYGDLVESLIKRIFEVKDSGSILPGHGGLLDRFDSALFALPAAIALLRLLELI